MRFSLIPQAVSKRLRCRRSTTIASLAALTMALGWASREAAFAREHAAVVAAQTVTLDQVPMTEARDKGQVTGKIGFYVQGDTPGSSNFVTGRFVIEPGKTPHDPHKHVEEEVMVIESGQGEIFCDGKTTKIGPGSVMYTTPNAPHGILNTGTDPLVFYFVKWASNGAPSSASK